DVFFHIGRRVLEQGVGKIFHRALDLVLRDAIATTEVIKDTTDAVSGCLLVPLQLLHSVQLGVRVEGLKCRQEERKHWGAPASLIVPCGKGTHGNATLREYASAVPHRS